MSLTPLINTYSASIRSVGIKSQAPGSEFKYLYFDFDGVMTDDTVMIDQSGKEYVTCSRLDGAGITLIKKANELKFLNLEMAIVSSEENSVVKARAAKLQIPCFQGVKNKYEFLLSGKSLSKKCEAPFDFMDLVFLGNDLNDLAVMQAAGLSISPNNAHPVIKEISTKTFAESGGKGFVRAVTEWLIGSANVAQLIEKV